MHGLFLGAALAALLLGDHAANKPEIWRECRLYRDLCYGPRPDEKGKRSGQFLDLIMPAKRVAGTDPKKCKRKLWGPQKIKSNPHLSAFNRFALRARSAAERLPPKPQSDPSPSASRRVACHALNRRCSRVSSRKTVCYTCATASESPSAVRRPVGR